MKLIFLMLLLASSSLFASKARMLALGQNSSTGSFYIDDSRNMFQNPATINFVKDYFLTEWGQSSDAMDQDSAPHAEGGIVKEFGNFIYGLYLGSEYNSYNQYRTSSFLKQDNRVDLFFAGDAGIKWAGHFIFGSTFDETSGFDKNAETLGVGLGIVSGNLSGFSNLIFKDESNGAETADDSWKRDLSYVVGGSYRLGLFTLFGQYEKGGYVATVSSETTEVTNSTILIGIGVKNEMENNSRLIANISLEASSSDRLADADLKQRSKKLPVVLGFESEVKDWLVLRSAVTQNIIIGDFISDDKKQTLFNSTVVTAGSTLSFGNVKIEGMLGKTAYSRVGNSSDEGVLSLDNLMTRVSLAYWF